MENTNLKPVIRFPEFTENWVTEKLRTKISFIAGYAFKSVKMKNVDSKYQLIKMSNIYRNQLDLKRNPSYWGDIDSKLEKYLLKKNDILLTLTGTVGKKDYGYSIVIPKNNRFLLNQRLVCLRAIPEKSNEHFINYLIKTSRFYYLFFSESKGGTGNQANVGVEDLRNIQLPIPKIAEQQKIANFLTSVDERITSLKEKKDTLLDFKKSVMQKIFNQDIRFKDDNGNDFPDWDEKVLGKVCSKESSNISANSLKNNNGTYKIYGATGHLQNVDFYKEENPYIAIIKDGSGVGRTLLCEAKSSVLGTLDILKTIDNNNLYFIYSLLNQIHFEKYVSGSTIPHIYFKDYSKELVKVPKPKEQIKITNYLSVLDDKIEGIQQKIDASVDFKKGLLQKMFV